MRFDVVSIFPELFTSAFSKGVVGQSLFLGENEMHLTDLRDFSEDKHRHIDDRPFGGGDGMVFRAGPLKSALHSIPRSSKSLRVFLSPQGRKLDDAWARELATFDQLILLCGRYGGVDERIVSSEIDVELSIGDYVLSGGEFAAFVLIDVLTRLQEGVLGNSESAEKDSFSNGWLEAPQFTRPRDFQGKCVPDILLSGDHSRIELWREKVSLLRTYFRRPDLLRLRRASQVMAKEAEELFAAMSMSEREVCGLPRDVDGNFSFPDEYIDS